MPHYISGINGLISYSANRLWSGLFLSQGQTDSGSSPALRSLLSLAPLIRSPSSDLPVGPVLAYPSPHSHCLIRGLLLGSVEADLLLGPPQTSNDSTHLCQALFDSYYFFFNPQKGTEVPYTLPASPSAGRTSVHREEWCRKQTKSWRTAATACKQGIVRKKDSINGGEGHQASCLHLVWEGSPKSRKQSSFCW